MKCPFCGEIDNKVIDSRLSKDGNVIRRRRECLICTRRFTTYEHIEEIPIMIPDENKKKKQDIDFLNNNQEKLPEKIIKQASPWHL